MQWSTACPDWERRILAGQSLIPFAPLFPDTAEEAMAVFRSLALVDVANSPLIGEMARPWVLDFAAAIFGAYDHENGRQLIREFFLLISKKNGKSTLAAAIMLTVLVLNWRESAEFLILAPTIEIAGNSFGPASDMVQASPDLRKLLHVAPFHRTIRHRTTGATLKVVAADNDTVAGKKAAVVLIDEHWLFGKRANAHNMIAEATGGLAARPEGFVISLSTMSDEPPAGVFRSKLEYARKVRDGAIVDPRFLPVLYEWPPHLLKAEAYRDEALWYVTNPNLGASVDAEFLRDKLRENSAAGAAELRGFFAKHLNVEIDVALKSGAWAAAEFWTLPGRAEPALTYAELLRRSEVVTIGADGGGRDDLLGFGAVGRERGTGRWLWWAKAWAWPAALAQRKSEQSRYEDFIRAGEMAIAGEVGDDVTEMVGLVQQARAAGLLPEKAGIGVDPGNHHVVTGPLLAAGVPEEQIAFVSQGWRLGGPMKLVERMLAEGALVHAGQALMAWCVGNAKVEPKGNAVIITKQASGTAKIDPLMAGLNAIELMARNPEPAGGRSFWDAEEAA